MSEVSSRSSRGLSHVLREHPLTSFFVLSYAVTWLLWSPAVLLGLPVFSPTTFAPTWYLMPAVAVGVTGVAFVMAAVTGGRSAVMRLLARLGRWRVGVVWFAVAVLLLPLAEIGAAVVLGAPDASAALTPAALVAYPAAYAAHFFFGPLFEESGWRGFALPRMQYRFGQARGTLVLGLLWSAWHFFLYVPVWFADGAVDGLVGLLLFTVTTTSMAFVFTWLSNNTGASLLLVVLLHGSVDGTATYLQRLAAQGVFPVDTASTIVLPGILVACVVLAVVLLVATRGRLSHDRYRDDGESLDVVGASPRPGPGA